MTATYTEPVIQLLKLGKPADPWLDYATLDITREHMPELTLLMQDSDLPQLERPADWPKEEDLPEWYAQIHAWRALAQLKTAEVIPDLLGILHQIDDDDNDWLDGDVGEMFSLIGPVALRPLAEYLADETNGLYARAAAATALQAMGTTHPETRDECIQALVAVLENYEENDDGLNGLLIHDLTELKAVESIELIKEAFEANSVDEFVMGDFEDVQIELGLLEERTQPRSDIFALPKIRSRLEEPFAGELSEPGFVSREKTAKEKEKEKSKRKQEKKSRKKNRKKK